MPIPRGLNMSEYDALWKTVLGQLELSLSKANFQTWFPLTFIKEVKKTAQNHQIVTIACPSPFVAETIQNRYFGQVKEVLDQETEKSNELVFIIAEKKKKVKISDSPLFQSHAQKNQKRQAIIQKTIQEARLRSDFTFANFAVSRTNQMAHAAAQAVAESPGSAYNPLYLYGGVGVGKTHLMQAIAHQLIRQNPKIKILYCTSEDFTNEIIDAIRTKKTNLFKTKYRQVKTLLIDDIQFIGGKATAQEELFHTFNAVRREGGQIVLTSNRAPEEIEGLENRLRSRFEGGLNIDVLPPDFELRCAILLIKAKQQNISLPMDIAHLIAANIESTRRLEGFLARLLTEIKIRNEKITPELVSSLLGNIAEGPITKKMVRPKEALDTVCNFFNLKPSQVKGSRRLKNLVRPRHILMYLLRHDLRMPLEEIGAFLGGRDHTSVLYAVEKITVQISESESLRTEIGTIKKRLYGF